MFRKIFANTKLSIKFRIKFEYEKKFVLSFGKQENPEIIFFRIALIVAVIVKNIKTIILFAHLVGWLDSSLLYIFLIKTQTLKYHHAHACLIAHGTNIQFF